VFFIVSVGRQLELSPCVCTASKSPSSWIDTARSFNSWRLLARATRMTRTLHLP
jgi:hypothetical protein